MTEHHPGALTVPRASVVDVDGRRGVYLIDDDTARFRPISAGIIDATLVEVLEGLNEGTHVVTTGATGLHDGDRVAVAAPARGRGGALPAAPPAGTQSAR